MASVIHHFSKHIKENGKVQLFEGSGGYRNGEQRRDFVFVRDLARLNMFFAQVGPYVPESGKSAKTYRAVVNAGSGRARSFNEVANALMQVHGKAEIEYVPFPADLQGRYQHFTEADLSGLRETGCNLEFTHLEDGIQETFSHAERVMA
jgi:ADP-L-glycero-D-manno-heptose 6-epimerase